MKKIFTSLFFIFLFNAIFCSHVFAQNNVSSLSGGVVVATVSINNTKIVSQNNRDFVISFDISNKIGTQPQIKYSIELIKISSSKQTILDEKVYPDTLSLSKNMIVHKIINYSIPESIVSGPYVLYIRSKNDSGLPLALARLGDIKITSTVTNTIEIVPNSCVFSMDINKYYSTSSQLISKKILKSTCKVKNQTSNILVLTPSFITRNYSSFGSIVPVFGSSTKKVVVKKDDNNINLEIAVPTKPQNYNLSFTLMSADKRIISNSISYNYNIDGEQGIIQNVVFDKTSYDAGETANLQIFSTQSSTSTITLIIKNNAGISCSATTSKDVSGVAITNILAPIIINCQNPKANILLSSNGVILDSNSFQNVTFGNNNAVAKTSLSPITIIISVLIIVLLVIIGILVYKNKYFGIAIILFGVSIFSVGIKHVEASTLNLFTDINGGGGSIAKATGTQRIYTLGGVGWPDNAASSFIIYPASGLSNWWKLCTDLNLQGLCTLVNSTSITNLPYTDPWGGTLPNDQFSSAAPLPDLSNTCLINNTIAALSWLPVAPNKSINVGGIYYPQYKIRFQKDGTTLNMSDTHTCNATQTAGNICDINGVNTNSRSVGVLPGVKYTWWLDVNNDGNTTVTNQGNFYSSQLKNFICAPATIFYSDSGSSFISYGSATNLYWSSTDTDNCTLYNSTDMGGTVVPLVGSTSTGRLFNHKDYSLDCERISPYKNYYLTLPVYVQSPQVNISADPTSVEPGSASNISWSSLSVDSCTINGNPVSLSGSMSTGNLTKKQSYNIACKYFGGYYVNNSVDVSVNYPAPTISNININPNTVSYNGNTIISANISNAASCSAIGNGSTIVWGNNPTSINLYEGNLKSNTTFEISCTGLGGDSVTSGPITINVSSQPDLSATITAASTTIPQNTSTTISWSSTGADSCTMNGSPVDYSGRMSTGNIASKQTYSINCSRGSISQCSGAILDVSPTISGAYGFMGGESLPIGSLYSGDPSHDGWINIDSVDHPFGSIISVQIANGGEGYSVGEELLVADSGGGAVKVTATDGVAGAIKNIHILSGGLGYKIGDKLIVQAGNYNAKINVDGVDENGSATEISLIENGSGYVSSYMIGGDYPLDVSGGNGTGLQLTIDNVYGKILSLFYDSSVQSNNYSVGYIAQIPGGIQGMGGATIQIDQVGQGIPTKISISSPGCDYVAVANYPINYQNYNFFVTVNKVQGYQEPLCNGAILNMSSQISNGSGFSIGNYFPIISSVGQNGTIKITNANNLNVVNGSINFVEIINGGDNYSVGDIINLTDSGDRNAVIKVESTDGVAGAIKDVAINSSGAGYKVGDQLTVIGGNNDALINVDGVDIGGEITAISIIPDHNGSKYTPSYYHDTTFFFDDLFELSGGNGSGATVTINGVYGAITSVSIVEQGSGYKDQSNVFIKNNSYPGGATGIINSNIAGVPTGFTIGNPGCGYSVGDYQVTSNQNSDPYNNAVVSITRVQDNSATVNKSVTVNVIGERTAPSIHRKNINTIEWEAIGAESCSLIMNDQTELGISNATSGVYQVLGGIKDTDTFTISCDPTGSTTISGKIINPNAECVPHQGTSTDLYINRNTTWTIVPEEVLSGSINASTAQWYGDELPVSNAQSYPLITTYTTVGNKYISGHVNFNNQDGTSLDLNCSTTTTFKLDTGTNGEI